MKKLILALFIAGLCVSPVFAANDVPASGTTSEPVKTEKVTQVKTTKSKAIKKNKKSNKVTETKKTEKKEDSKEVISK